MRGGPRYGKSAGVRLERCDSESAGLQASLGCFFLIYSCQVRQQNGVCAPSCCHAPLKMACKQPQYESQCDINPQQGPRTDGDFDLYHQYLPTLELFASGLFASALLCSEGQAAQLPPRSIYYSAERSRSSGGSPRFPGQFIEGEGWDELMGRSPPATLASANSWHLFQKQSRTPKLYDLPSGNSI